MTRKIRELIRDRLRISDETWSNANETMRQPGIFEIRCIPSGRYYIGASSRPDLRRATYYFYLRNPNIFNNANIFFGNSRVLDDLEQYGVDSFEFHMLGSYPNATERVLNNKKWELIESANKSKLYNKDIGQGNYVRAPFIKFDDISRNLYEQRRHLEERISELDALRIHNRNIAKIKNIEINRAVMNGEIDYIKRDKAMKENSATWRPYVAELKKLRDELKIICEQITIRNAELIKKYSR